MLLSRLARMTVLLVLASVLTNQLACAAEKPVDIASVKTKIQARGVGHGVRITLADKTQQKGQIISIGEQTFSLRPIGSNQPIDVSYGQVTGIHRDKMSTGAKVGIAAGVVVGTIAIIAIVLTIQFKHSL